MRRSASKFPIAIAALLICGSSSACRERGQTASTPEGEPAEEPIAAPSGPVRIVYPAAPGSFVDLSAELAPSVVHLKSTHKVSGGPAALIPESTDSHALGSALVLDRQGHLLTSEHLIATAPEVHAVLADGSEVPAQVVGRDGKLDLALLKIEVPPGQLKPARLGDSDLLRVGEWVLALGNPFGVEVSASAGIISSLGGSDHDAIAGSRTSYQSFLRTDAKIDVGNSGGPLVDTSGSVVGINSAVSTQSGDMRFVIPINRARQILPMLKEDGVVTRSWLGVFVHPVTAEVARQRQLQVVSGALVSDVVAGSPAAKAGIKAGDVILEFDGKPVDHRNLPWLASTAGVGRQIPVKVWRAGAARELQLVSEKMPE